MNAYEKLENTATGIDSGIRALLLSLSDLQNEPDPYRLHGAIILAKHLQDLARDLDNAVAETGEVLT